MGDLSYNGWTNELLMAFEQDIENEFLLARIRAPIHLSKGNEDSLIRLFLEHDIGNGKNYCFSSHRSHLHALLHGIPAAWLKEQILLGRSMHINSQQHRFMTSSIVGGCASIAAGVAAGLKRQDSKDKVWCFVGDMAASAGEFYNASKYAECQNLPIWFVVECNGLATNSPTYDVWGMKHKCHDYFDTTSWGEGGIERYCYPRLCEHINVGKWVEFR